MVDENDRVKLLGVPYDVPLEAPAVVRDEEEGTVLMSPSLVQQLPEIQGEAILQAQAMHYLAYVDVKPLKDEEYTLSGILVGIMFDEKHSELSIRTLIDDAMKLVKLFHEYSNVIKGFQLAKPDDEEPFIEFDTQGCVSCRIDEIEIMKDMCTLSIKVERKIIKD
jgi:hypothetical protein